MVTIETQFRQLSTLNAQISGWKAEVNCPG
jgi:hypothetical protein